MAIIPEPGGLKTLTIHFRWSLFPNASIEVRLVPGPNRKGPRSTPIYFAEHLKGTVREALYTCLDHPGEGGRTHSFTKDKIVYKMIGRRNSLGNQGVHVQVHPKTVIRRVAAEGAPGCTRPSSSSSGDMDSRTQSGGCLLAIGYLGSRSGDVVVGPGSGRVRQAGHALRLVLSRQPGRLGRADSLAGVQVGPFCRKGLMCQRLISG